MLDWLAVTRGNGWDSNVGEGKDSEPPDSSSCSDVAF